MKIVNKIFITLLCTTILLSCKQNSTKLPERKTFSNNLVFPDTTYKIKLTYFGMGCPCPQWATSENINLYESQIGKIPMDSLFVNVVEEEGYQQNPFDLESWKKNNENSNTFIFEGRLSTNKFKWQAEDGIVWENKVFQYSSCKFVEKEKNDH